MSYREQIQQKEKQRIIEHMITNVTNHCHGLAIEGGWWADPATGEKLDRNDGQLICLMHSELSEAMEAVRKDLKDDHLPQFPGVAVELADCMIRIMDYAGARGLPLGEALAAKLAYNAKRQDHKPSERAKAGGKKF